MEMNINNDKVETQTAALKCLAALFKNLGPEMLRYLKALLPHLVPLIEGQLPTDTQARFAI